VIPDKIYEIYTQYGDEMRNILLRIAIDSLSDTSTGFTSYEFFTMRTNISKVMWDDLDARLQKELHC